MCVCVFVCVRACVRARARFDMSVSVSVSVVVSVVVLLLHTYTYPLKETEETENTRAWQEGEVAVVFEVVVICTDINSTV